VNLHQPDEAFRIGLQASNSLPVVPPLSRPVKALAIVDLNPVYAGENLTATPAVVFTATVFTSCRRSREHLSILLQGFQPPAKVPGTNYPYSCSGPVSWFHLFLEFQGPLALYSYKSVNLMQKLQGPLTFHSYKSFNFLQEFNGLLIHFCQGFNILEESQGFNILEESQGLLTLAPTNISASTRVPGTVHPDSYKAFILVQESRSHLRTLLVSSFCKSSCTRRRLGLFVAWTKDQCTQLSKAVIYFANRNKTYAHTLVLHKKESVSMQ
jgi:hypothetical protein